MITLAPPPVPTARIPQAKTENRQNVPSASREKTSAADQPARSDRREQNSESPRDDSGWKSTRSAELQSSGANLDAVSTPITQQASFEALLNHALGETFSPEAFPVRNTKPGVPAAPDPKRDSQGRANEAAIPELVKAPMHDPLPLMISLSFANPKGDLNQRNTSNGQQNGGTEISSVDSKEEAAQKLTLSGETAFTASVKISDQVPFAIPQGEPNVGSAPVPVAAAEPDAAKIAGAKVSAVEGRAMESSVAEISSGQLNQAAQAVLTPAANRAVRQPFRKRRPR